MNTVTKHRGPDATKTALINNSAIGFNRLEIVGGSKGQQPITNEDNTMILICNGEIFNYKKLKEKYTPRHRFKTESDVEVILHLYEEYQDRCVSLLEGQFAFLILDKQSRSVFFARDRFGILPLFYTQKNGTFIAASEIKSIFSSRILGQIKLDPIGVQQSWFFYGSVPPRTCFSDISQLPPGHIGQYLLDSKTLTIKKYWDFQATKVKTTDLRKLEKEIYRLLDESVSLRLQGNYRPGVYISGGLDSSIIAYLVKKNASQTPILFGIGFRKPQYDESLYQDLLAKSLACPLIRVSVDEESIVGSINDCVYHTETPLIRSAPIPMLFLSKEARKNGCKYVLCGEGADELFFGYPVFQHGKSSIEEKWQANLSYKDFFLMKTEEVNIRYEALTRHTSENNHDNVRITEINTKLSNYLLSNQGDRLSMANSIEQRFPYLDTKIVEFAFSIEPRCLSKNGIGKALLRDTFRSMLPRSIVNRKKQGYLAPDRDVVIKLLQTDQNARLFSEEVTHAVGIFDYVHLKHMKNLLQENKELPEETSRFLFFICTTHILAEMFT